MQEDILTQILTKNYAEKEFTLGKGLLKVKLRTISVKEQLEIEDQVSKIDSSRVYLLHQYSLALLKKCLQEYNGVVLVNKTEEERGLFIDNLTTGVVDILVKLRDDFQNEVLKLLVPEELEAHFFPQKSSGEESNSSSKDLTSKNIKTQLQNS